MDGPEGICQPIMVPNWPDPCIRSPSTGSGGDSCHFPLENQTWFSQPPRDVSGPLMADKRQPVVSRLPPAASRMESLRQQYHNQRFSEAATSLMLSSWRMKSNKYHDSLFGGWSHWCSEQDRNPTQGPIQDCWH